MQKLGLYFCLCFIWGIQAQNDNTIQSGQKSVKIVKSDNVNSLEEQYINEDLSILTDDYFAKLIDSLWFNNEQKSPLHFEYEDYYATAYAPELSTEILKGRLQFLNSKTPFNVEYNPQLENIIKSFLKNRKDKYEELLSKSKYYFPLIEEQLAKYNIPLEMKYLVVVESALNPTARSKMGAAGLWQFMYQTGKMYKLNVSSYVDERHDVLKATIAACEFLNDLYDTFKDWDLALAAYNSGPGNVSKAIRRSGGSRNYWNIRHHLPRETASYVPLFYTTMYLFEFAEAHQIHAKDVKIQYYETDTLTVQEQISFKQIKDAIPISHNVLKFLNPQYKLEIIPAIPNKKYSVRLPKNFIGQFVQNESRIYQYAKTDANKREKPLPKYTELNNRINYKVRSGDSLGKLGKRYGVSIANIKKWNNLRSTNIRIGQRLIIYPRKL